MYRIKKQFTGYPFAHRQHTHGGHCKQVHGHNWDFEICLEAEELDENGFVYDFGNFGWLKRWLEETFDHTILINKDDPEINTFRVLDGKVLNLIEVESCSSEGIAKMVYEKIQERIKAHKSHRNVKLVYVVVQEDTNNSAQYTGE